MQQLMMIVMTTMMMVVMRMRMRMIYPPGIETVSCSCPLLLLQGRTLDEFQICSQNRCREPPEVSDRDPLPPAPPARAPPEKDYISDESSSDKEDSEEQDRRPAASPPPESPNPSPKPSPSPSPSESPSSVSPKQSPDPWKPPSAANDSLQLTPWQKSVLEDLAQKLNNQDLTPWQRGELQRMLNEKRESFLKQKQTTSSISHQEGQPPQQMQLTPWQSQVLAELKQQIDSQDSTTWQKQWLQTKLEQKLDSWKQQQQQQPPAKGKDEGESQQLQLTPWQHQVLAELKKKINAPDTTPWQQTQLQKEFEQKLSMWKQNAWKQEQSFLMKDKQGDMQLTPWQHSVLEELKDKINSPNVTKLHRQKLQNEMEEKLSLWETRQGSQGSAADGAAEKDVETKDQLDSSDGAFSRTATRDASAPVKVPRAITQPHLQSPKSRPETLDELMDEDECAANELLAKLCIAADVDISQEVACQSVADGLVKTCHVDEIQDEEVQRFMQYAEDSVPSGNTFDDDGLEYIAVIPSIGVFNDSDGYALDYNDPQEVQCPPPFLPQHTHTHTPQDNSFGNVTLVSMSYLAISLNAAPCNDIRLE